MRLDGNTAFQTQQLPKPKFSWQRSWGLKVNPSRSRTLVVVKDLQLVIGPCEYRCSERVATNGQYLRCTTEAEFRVDARLVCAE